MSLPLRYVLLVLVLVPTISDASSQVPSTTTYVISTIPASFAALQLPAELAADSPTAAKFKAAALEAIANCCGGPDRVALSCPAGKTCENIEIDEDGTTFTIVIGIDHFIKAFPGSQTVDYKRRSQSPQERQEQIIDWLRQLVRCDYETFHVPGQRPGNHRFCTKCVIEPPPDLNLVPKTRGGK